MHTFTKKNNKKKQQNLAYFLMKVIIMPLH